MTTESQIIETEIKIEEMKNKGHHFCFPCEFRKQCKEGQNPIYVDRMSLANELFKKDVHQNIINIIIAQEFPCKIFSTLKAVKTQYLKLPVDISNLGSGVIYGKL